MINSDNENLFSNFHLPLDSPNHAGHPNVLREHRNSDMIQGNIYFWTATINSWIPLLTKDVFKDIIINSWKYLSEIKKIDVFAFIIMPTHLHTIWRINEPNGKESPQGSFLKFTAHQFQKVLRKQKNNLIGKFSIEASNKSFEFWQRDPLAVPIFTRKVALQKLNYLHNNPLGKRWQLANHPCDYKYSSAKYYERGIKEFNFLEDLWEVI